MNLLNSVRVIGYLGSDPEFNTNGSTRRANFQLAINESWTDEKGNRQESTDWVPVVAWGARAELAHKYLAKGKRIALEGKFRSNRVERDGQVRTYYAVEMREFLFLTPKTEDDPPRHRESGREPGED